MKTVWVVCLGDKTNPRALFTSKTEADAYAASLPSLVVFEGRVGDTVYVNLTSFTFGS